MSHLLEILGRGLSSDIGDMLDRYFWSTAPQSLEKLRECCREHPDWPDIHFQLGLAYLRAVQIDEAIEHLSQACHHKPDYLAARLALAAAYDEQARHDKALKHLEIANQNSPGEPPILFCIGFCLERLRQPERAAEYYRDVVSCDPGFVPARQRLAAVSVFLKNLEEAIEQYEVLRQLRPEETWIRSALGHLYYRAGEYDRSVEQFENAIAMEPENWSLADDEVEVLVADGLIREAIERLEMLIEQRGPFADLHVRLADLYSQTGNDEAAMYYYRNALGIHPDYLEASVKIGTHHLICGRWEEAADAFHTACELNDSMLVNYVGIGVAEAAAGRTTEAMNSFDLAVAIEPNSTLLLTEMARLQLKASVAEEFVRSFEAGCELPTVEIDLDNDDLLKKQIDGHAAEIERHPDHADLRYRYGVLLRSEGRLAEATEQFTEAVQINPTYVKAIIKLAITQQDLGQIEESIDTFTRALDIEPTYVDLHYRLGLLYTDRKQFEEAVKHMEDAAAGAPDNRQIRAGLALSLQNMGLMDKSAATWRSLSQLHRVGT